MLDFLTRKLECFGPLPEADKRLLQDIAQKPRKIAAHRDLIREDDAPSNFHLVVKGFAYRYKQIENGERQILAFLVPGDLCDLHVFILKTMDHSIATLSACEVVFIPPARVLEMLERPILTRALWWATLVDEATLREWLVNMGQRDAEVRLAHLLCELHTRLKAVGLADDTHFDIPITQVELADTLGMSPVHVNRCIKSLRERNILSSKSNGFIIHDIEAFRSFSGFDPKYLHLEFQRNWEPAAAPQWRGASTSAEEGSEPS